MNGWKRKEDMDYLFPSGTKVYLKKDMAAAVSKENGLWHISISTKNRTIDYDDLKDARYSLVPDDCHMAQIFPPKSEFVNLHPFCFHLYQITDQERGVA